MRINKLHFIVTFLALAANTANASPETENNASYKIIPITEEEYNSDVSGNVYKEYSKAEDNTLTPKYYKYEINTDKQYNETITKEGTGSGDGSNTVVNAGVGLNNSSTISNIDNTLYKDNSYTYNYTGDNTTVYIRGGAIYNEGTIGEKNESGEFINTSIEADFIGNSVTTQTDPDGLLRAQGGAIANLGEIGNIKGDFIENSTTGNFSWGGAIYNDAKGTIQNVDGDFIGNNVNGNSSGGGAILNEGKIGTLNSDFINNHVKTDNYSAGGAIHNDDNGSIDEINGNFIDNKSLGDNQAYGGAIDNYYGTIKSITGDFNNNSAHSENAGRASGAFGGAISNQSGKINNITSNFYGNSASSQVYSQGGAIYNSEAGIENIQGDFIENSAKSEVSTAEGGAIYNENGNINNIAGTFANNTAVGQSDSLGGAIVNKKQVEANSNENNYTIENINSDFIGNSATSAQGVARGGAIYNTGGAINKITGSFTNNNTIGKDDASGGAIYNYSGTINEINGDFSGNSTQSNNTDQYTSAFGGAISNLGGTINNINGNFYNNKAQSNKDAGGGAIYNTYLTDIGSIKNIKGDFIGNSATSTEETAAGGAIYNDSGNIKITGTFANNSAIGKDAALGGAIYNRTSNTGNLELVNSNFYNNSATSSNGIARGGAIYANQLSITAEGADSVFSGNTANGTNNAIYIEKKAGPQAASAPEKIYADQSYLLLQTKDSGNIIFDDSIDGEEYNIVVQGDNTGEVVFNSYVNNAATFDLVDSAAIHLGKEAQINTLNYNAINTNGTPTLTLDVELNPTDNTISNGIINASGDVTGTTNVIVNSLNRNTLDKLEDATTIFVKAPNDNDDTASTFNVTRVINSPYMWDSIRNYGGETTGSNWYLVAKEDPSGNSVYAPEIPAYVGLQTAAIEQNRGLSHKIGAALDVNKDKGCCDRRFRRTNNAWINADYDSAEIDAPSEMDVNIQGLTAGIDLYTNNAHRFGIFGAYRQGEYDLSGKSKYTAETGSSIDIDSYLGGLYYEYNRYNWKILATLFGGKQDIDISTDDNIVSADTTGTQYGASVELARKFYLPYAWIIEPSASLYYSALDLDGFNDNMGKQVDFDLTHYMEAELGLRLEHLFCLNGWTTKVYAKPSIIQTFASGDKTRISGLSSTSTYENQTLGRMEVGAKFGITPSLSAYTSANYTFGSDYSGYGVDAGLNYMW